MVFERETYVTSTVFSNLNFYNKITEIKLLKIVFKFEKYSTPIIIICDALNLKNKKIVI